MDKMHKFRPIIVEEESGGAGLQWEKYSEEELEFASDEGMVWFNFPNQPIFLMKMTLIRTENPPDETYVAELYNTNTDDNLIQFDTSDLGVPYEFICDGIHGDYALLLNGSSEGWVNVIKTEFYILNDNGNIVDLDYLRQIPRIEE